MFPAIVVPPPPIQYVMEYVMPRDLPFGEMEATTRRLVPSRSPVSQLPQSPLVDVPAMNSAPLPLEEQLNPIWADPSRGGWRRADSGQEALRAKIAQMILGTATRGR